MSIECVFEPKLSERTTLRLGGTARVEIRVREERDLEELPKLFERHGAGARTVILGKGSNLLARDGELDLVLVRAANRSFPETRPRPDGKIVRIRAGAGYPLPGLLGRLTHLGLSGLEGLTGIPGDLGGAMAMNAGSYGVELADRVSRVRIWTPEAGLAWADMAECRTGYRAFEPPGNPEFALVWEVELELEPEATATIRKRMRTVYGKKQRSQPVTAWTCGCVFKNPEGESAGRLLDQAGFRGKRVGGMELSSMHANFLVNTGKGESGQALELIELAREAVERKFGQKLETEVVIVP